MAFSYSIFARLTPMNHAVFNQSSPFSDVNLFEGNAALKTGYSHYTGEKTHKALSALGAKAGSADYQEAARLANIYTPVLKTHDMKGNRVDEVEFHESYHKLMRLSIENGLHGAAFSGEKHAHLTRAIGFMMMTELEPSHLCPISMSYAAMPALTHSPSLKGWMEKLQTLDYDPVLQSFDKKRGVLMGMGMTEKQGGSDVRANSTTATLINGDTYAINGHKWFFSAPMCDAFLVLAQTTTGLSCFFMPRILENGAKNAIHIQRLKDKLGNKANASSEVEFHNATGFLVGDEGRGIPTILDMGVMTRLDCALGTTGLMRHALSLALHHARERNAFGKPLIEQPLMQNVLADMVLEVEAATALCLRLAHAIDQKETALARLLTPLAKFWICKRGSLLAQEAMECLGGNGYVEGNGEGIMARIYREMPLNSIWEGAGNIMCLDMLRALRKEEAVKVLSKELREEDAKRLPYLLEVSNEMEARRLAQELTLMLQAALLEKTAPAFISKAFIESRLKGNWGNVFGTLPASTDFEAILAYSL